MKPTAENDRYRSTVLNDSSAMVHPHSKLGIAACICSVLAWVLLVVLAMVPDWVSLLGWSNGALALVFMLALLGMLLGLMCVRCILACCGGWLNMLVRKWHKRPVKHKY